MLGLAIVGATAFGVQTLFATTVSTCPTDPIEICTLGGNEFCAMCCIQESSDQIGGTCDAAPGVCLCIQG